MGRFCFFSSLANIIIFSIPVSSSFQLFVFSALGAMKIIAWRLALLTEIYRKKRLLCVCVYSISHLYVCVNTNELDLINELLIECPFWCIFPTILNIRSQALYMISCEEMHHEKTSRKSFCPNASFYLHFNSLLFRSHKLMSFILLLKRLNPLKKPFRKLFFQIFLNHHRFIVEMKYMAGWAVWLCFYFSIVVESHSSCHA